MQKAWVIIAQSIIAKVEAIQYYFYQNNEEISEKMYLEYNEEETIWWCIPPLMTGNRIWYDDLFWAVLSRGCTVYFSPTSDLAAPHCQVAGIPAAHFKHLEDKMMVVPLALQDKRWEVGQPSAQCERQETGQILAKMERLRNLMREIEAKVQTPTWCSLHPMI